MFPVFLVIWIILGAASLFLFVGGSDAMLKRKLFPPFIIGATIFFVISVFFMDHTGRAIYVMLPAAVVITILNLKLTKFCGNCGAMSFPRSLFWQPKFCGKCGRSLTGAQ